MNSATLQLIIALLPLAEELVFTIGGQIVKLNTSTLTDPATIVAAFKAASDKGFPQLTFAPAQPVA